MDIGDSSRLPARELKRKARVYPRSYYGTASILEGEDRGHDGDEAWDFGSSPSASVTFLATYSPIAHGLYPGMHRACSVQRAAS